MRFVELRDFYDILTIDLQNAELYSKTSWCATVSSDVDGIITCILSSYLDPTNNFTDIYTVRGYNEFYDLMLELQKSDGFAIYSPIFYE